MKSTFLKTASLVLACSVSQMTHADEAPAKITYDDHVRPVFRQHCFSCHNQNEKKGGLALDSYASVIEGGASGEVVYDGDSSSSRLWMLMAHEDTPVMPPSQDKLADPVLKTVSDWIDGGLLENAGSTAKKKKANKLAFAATADGRPEGAVAMPETVWQQPVVVTERSAAVTAIRCSPWAPVVAIGGQRQVILYNTDTAELIGILPFPEGEPQALNFSNDGGYLLVGGGQHSSQGFSVLYDLKTGDRVARAGDELDIVFGADLNDKLTKVAVGGPQRLIRIHDMETGEKLFELKKHTDWVFDVQFSPDGVLIASGDRAGGLVLWEADTGRFYLDLVGHKDAVRGIAWRADSNVVASASMDGTVKLWEIFNGQQVKNFNAHGGGVTAIDMARDGRIVTCGIDRTVKLWDANGNAVRSFPAFPEAALEVAFSHDGKKIVAGDWTGLVKMWDSEDPTKEVVLSSNPPRLETRLEAAKVHLASSVSVFDAQTATLKAAQEKLTAATTQMQTLTEQVAAAKTASETAEAARVQAVTALEQANTALAAATNQHVASTTAAANAGKAVDDLAAARDKILGEIKQFEANRQASIAARDASANAIAALDAEFAKVTGNDEASNNRRAELSKKREEAVAQHIQQRQAVDAALAQCESASGALQGSLANLINAQKQAKDSQAALGQHQVDLVVARGTQQTAAMALTAATAKAEQAKQMLATLEQQLATVQQQIAPLTEGRDQAQQSLNAATVTRDGAASSVTKLEKALADFQTAATQLPAAEASTNEQLSAAMAKIEQTLASVTSTDGEITATDAQMKELSARLDELRAQLAQMQATKQQLESEKDTVASQAEELESNLQQIADRRALYEAAYGNSGK